MIVAGRGRLDNERIPVGGEFLELLLGHRHFRHYQFFFLKHFKVTHGRVGHFDDVGLRLQQFRIVVIGPSLERRRRFPTVDDG